MCSFRNSPGGRAAAPKRARCQPRSMIGSLKASPPPVFKDAKALIEELNQTPNTDLSATIQISVLASASRALLQHRQSDLLSFRRVIATAVAYLDVAHAKVRAELPAPSGGNVANDATARDNGCT